MKLHIGTTGLANNLSLSSKFRQVTRREKWQRSEICFFHIQIVEWVYPKVLHGEPWEDEWKEFGRMTVEGIFAVAAEAQPKLRAYAASASEEQLAKEYKIVARSGQSVTGSGRKFLTHTAIGLRVIEVGERRRC